MHQSLDPSCLKEGCWFERMEAALHSEGNSWGRLIIADYLLRAFTVRGVKNHPFVKCDLDRIWACPYWFKKINSIGNSLVVQWLGLHTSTAWQLTGILTACFDFSEKKELVWIEFLYIILKQEKKLKSNPVKQEFGRKKNHAPEF